MTAAAKLRLILALLSVAAATAAGGILLDRAGVFWASLGTVALGRFCFPRATAGAIDVAVAYAALFLERASEWCFTGSIVVGSALLVAGGLFTPDLDYLGIVARVVACGVAASFVLLLAVDIITGKWGEPLRPPQELPAAEAAQAEADELLTIEWEKEKGGREP